MRLFLALAGLLLALALAAWIFLRPASVAVSDAEAATLPAAAPAAPEAGTWRGAESVVPPGSLERSEIAAPEAAADPKAPVYATPAADNEGFLVRVVRKEGGAPIPFADVFYVDVANLDPQRMAAAQAASHSLLEMIEFLAARYRAGADGSVRLPLPADQLWLAARSDRWFGTFDNKALPPEGVTIECTPMSAVSALVTDAEGRPQPEIPVHLSVTDGGHEQSILSVRTDARGIAIIQPLDMLARDSGGATFALGLAGILAEPVRAEFDVRNPPEEPLHLVLPPHGMLEVRLTAADGQPWAEQAIVLAWNEQAIAEAIRAGQEARSSRDPMEGEGLSGVLTSGTLLLRPVGLGQPLMVRAKRADGTTIGEARAAGPSRSGETVRVEVLEQSGASVVTGRALRADGKPFARARLSYELESSGARRNSASSGPLQTDTDGAFRLEIEEPAWSEGSQRVLKLRAGGAPGSAEMAEADLSWSLPPGVTDLGNLVLTLPPLLVSGRVMDDAGTPLPGVFVQVRAQVFYSKDQFYWNWEDGLQARSGADGSFAIHGKTDSALIRVTGSDEERWCAGSDVPPGSTGVQVVMRAAGRVSGKILLDAGANAEGMSLQLVSELEGDRETTHWGARIEEEGGFNFDTVPPGRYRLELSTQGSQAALAELDGLLVVAGEDCADPRLKPFDVRGQLRVLRVRAVDENGKPLQNFQVVEQRPDGNREHFWASQDEVLVPLRETPSDLLVMLEGCLTVRIEDAVGDCEVRLVPGPRIRLVLSGAGSLPAGHRLVVGLKSAAGSVEDASGPSADVDAAGVAEFSAPLTGLCALTLVMYGTIDDITHGAWVELENVEIDVRPAGGTQSFTVNVDPAQLQKAVDLIAKQRGS